MESVREHAIILLQKRAYAKYSFSSLPLHLLSMVPNGARQQAQYTGRCPVFGGADGLRQRKKRRRHKRGHSAMALWVTHQETKTAARKQRRLAARRLERKATKATGGTGRTKSRSGCD
jgi:hypothetical protein